MNGLMMYLHSGTAELLIMIRKHGQVRYTVLFQLDAVTEQQEQKCTDLI